MRNAPRLQIGNSLGVAIAEVPDTVGDESIGRAEILRGGAEAYPIRQSLRANRGEQSRHHGRMVHHNVNRNEYIGKHRGSSVIGNSHHHEIRSSRISRSEGYEAGTRNCSRAERRRSGDRGRGSGGRAHHRDGDGNAAREGRISVISIGENHGIVSGIARSGHVGN